MAVEHKWHFLKFNRYGLLRAIARDGRDLAKIAREAGISYNNMQKLADVKCERKCIRPDTVDKLCKALDVDRSDLIYEG